MVQPGLSASAWSVLAAHGPKYISKIKEVGKRKPPCEAHVRLAAGDTLTKRIRVSEAVAAGRKPDQCGRPSMWRINNRCYCQNHAGQEAINTLVMICNGGTL